ncbi:hypothetical protein PFISCL1PPCAC_13197, partial [Pristionchus fissidentatus]
RSCLVCSAPVVFAQLGMDVCRACCEFFKRVRTSGNEYPCRQGNGKCPTTQAKRSICRRCRFDKCVTVGLKYGGPVIQRKLPAPSILERIEHEWKSFIERRRVQELALAKASGWKNRIEHPTELYNVHEMTCYEIFGVFVAESFTFFKRAFPAFGELCSQERELIFKDFVGKYSLIECYYRSRLLWGGVQQFIMCSVVTCYDVGLPMGSEAIEKDNAVNRLLHTRSAADELHSVLLPVFNKSNIVEKEYHALIALLLCELDVSCGVSEDALVILDRYRKEILEDLQAYYKNELGLTDYSTRLGNLMSLNHVLQECRSLFSVVIRFYDSMFDLYVTNDMMKRFFL